MSNYKEPQDKTAAYLSRDGKWFKMDKESVRKVCGRPRLRNTAKIAFFALQPYFHDGNGLLIEPLEHVALDLGTTKDKLSEDIDILVGAGILRRTQAGLLYDPVSYKLITKNEEPPDAKFCRISQDSAKFGENLHSSPGQNASVEYSREVSGDPHPTKRTVTTEQKNRENYRTDATLSEAFPGLTEKDLEAVKEQFADLVFADVYAKFVTRANRDGKKRVTLNYLRGFFDLERKFLAKKSGSAATASPGPAKNEQVKAKPEPEESKEPTGELPKLEYRDCPRQMKSEIGNYGSEIRKPFGWYIDGKKIADWGFVNPFADQCRNMPSGNAEECRQYLLSLTPKVKDWDTRAALSEFSGDDRRSLFTETNWDADSLEPTEWSGFETAEEEMKMEEAAIS